MIRIERVKCLNTADQEGGSEVSGVKVIWHEQVACLSINIQVGVVIS